MRLKQIISPTRRCGSVGTNPRDSLTFELSLRRLLEISQIRRRLVFPGGHQDAVGAEHIALLGDFDVIVVLGADALAPYRSWIRDATIALLHGPRTGQRIVDH